MKISITGTGVEAVVLNVPRGEREPVIRALTQMAVTLWLMQEDLLEDCRIYRHACSTSDTDTTNFYESIAKSRGVFTVTTHDDSVESMLKE